MSNKKVGNDFESEFCQLLYQNDFWVHNLANRHYGQPADVIACKGNNCFLIDCKVCEGDTFKRSRIEDNQHDAMTYWKKATSFECYFAVKFVQSGQIYMLPYSTFDMIAKDPTEKVCADLGLNVWEFMVYASTRR